ncbi:peptide deformylase [Paractinoplanes rhizophilus]|uniref:Peptide deformylase n=1 Tax=Paractinoplanes rhizophilus TaxID=1416877 RepID=A0ABW2HUA3_9ACTN
MIRLLHDHGEVHYDGRSYHVVQRRRVGNDGETARHAYEFEAPGPIDVAAWFTLTKPGRGQAGSPHLGRRQPVPAKPLGYDGRRVRYLLTYPLDTPLAPGAEAVVEYRYRAAGPQRYEGEIAATIEAISMEAHLPAALAPVCWGMSVPPSGDGPRPLPDVTVRDEPGKVVYSWSARAGDEGFDEGGRVRLDWFFWRRIPESTRAERAADVLGQFGILQMPDPARGGSVQSCGPARGSGVQTCGPARGGGLGDLAAVARPLDLDRPADRELAGDVLRHLREVAGWVGRFHAFSPEVSRGIAAPQLGIGCRIAIVSRPAGGSAHDAGLYRDGYLELVNPRIVEETIETVTDYEGCLSFFDVRGRVRRPYGIKVSVDGRSEPRVFAGPVARSIAHEIDHLNGKVYTDADRMPAGERPLAVADYRRMRAENRLGPAPVPTRLTWRPV